MHDSGTSCCWNVEGSGQCHWLPQGQLVSFLRLRTATRYLAPPWCMGMLSITQAQHKGVRLDPDTSPVHVPRGPVGTPCSPGTRAWSSSGQNLASYPRKNCLSRPREPARPVPVPAAGEQRVVLTKAKANHSLQQPHAKLGPKEGWRYGPPGQARERGRLQWGGEGEREVPLQLPGLGKVAELEKAQRQTMDHEDAGLFRCCSSSSDKVPKGYKSQQGLEGFLLPRSSSALGLVPR